MDNSKLSIGNANERFLDNQGLSVRLYFTERYQRIMKQLGEVFSKLEIESANDFLTTIVPLEPLRDKKNSFEGVNQKYNETFDGSLMRHGIYYDCEFTNINFEGTVGNNTVLRSCKLNNCTFGNSNFIYSDFSNSELTITSHSNRYDYSDFSYASIKNSKLDASSFRECYFQNSRIENSKIYQCELTNSTFKKCFLKKLDLSSASLDYSEFYNTEFYDVILPFFGILNVVTGFEQIATQKDVLFKPASSDYIVKSDEYVENIRLLKPIFFSENNFLALANIYAYDGEIENTYATIFHGLEYACKEKEFSLIRQLCRFASINNYFNLNQLKSFYEFLENNIDVKQLDYVTYRNYLNELYIAKRLLIDCPFNRDIIEIKLKTYFKYSDSAKLAETYRIINTTIERYAPDSNNHIIVRHNSPVDITLIVSDNIYVLYLVFFALQLILCKSFNGIEKIQNLIKNRHEIKLQKLEEEIKKLEIEKLKKELDNPQTSNTILLQNDFNNISYLVRTINDLPNELRRS